MWSPYRVSVFLLAALSTLSAPARAADEAAEKPVKATVNIGYVQTGGNTDVVTLLASDKLQWKKSAWVFTQDGGAVYGENSGTENAGRYDVGLRADYSMSSRVSLYGLTSWKRNEFAGVRRQFDEGLGAAFHAVITKPHLLDLELGAGMIQRLTTASTDENFSTARLAALYKYSFAEKASFELSGDWLLNLEDTENNEINGQAKLAAPLAGGLSLSLGYDANYRSQPLAGLERLDWTVSAGLQINY